MAAIHIPHSRVTSQKPSMPSPLATKRYTEGKYWYSPTLVFGGKKGESMCQRVHFLRNAEVHNIDKYKAFLEYPHGKKLSSNKKCAKP